MDDSKDCPKCRLVNPVEARQCDCGYDFVTRRAGMPPRTSGGPTPAVVVFATGFGAVVGGALGVPLRMWAGKPTEAGCGLYYLPLMIEGLVGGLALGGMAGAILAMIAGRHA